MANPRNRSCKRRPGLTLLELIVVLVVLVALAGILIPMLPNVVGRASTSVGATNAGEVDRWIQLYQQTNNGAYPDFLDNLAGTGTAPIDYLPGYLAGGTSLTQITVGNLSPEQLSALNAAGISTVATLTPTRATFPNGGSPTFNPYQYTGTNIVLTTLTTSTPVAFLTEAAVETPPGLVRDNPNTNSGDIYVVFGFGKQTTAIGKIVPDAPVHFSQFAADTATNVYCRYGLVFRLARGTGSAASPASTPLTQAQFVGAVSFEPTGIMGSDGQLANYYDNIMKQQ